jgi:hypothetical protein
MQLRDAPGSLFRHPIEGAINDLGLGIHTDQVTLTNDLSKSPLSGFDFSLGAATGLVKPAPFSRGCLESQGECFQRVTGLARGPNVPKALVEAFARE